MAHTIWHINFAKLLVKCVFNANWQLQKKNEKSKPEKDYYRKYTHTQGSSIHYIRVLFNHKVSSFSLRAAIHSFSPDFYSSPNKVSKAASMTDRSSIYSQYGTQSHTIWHTNFYNILQSSWCNMVFNANWQLMKRSNEEREKTSAQASQRLKKYAKNQQQNLSNKIFSERVNLPNNKRAF